MYKNTKKDVEQFIVNFCQDALSGLKSFDRKMRNKFTKGEETGATSKFYKGYLKGISIYSITEPIIKWLIYTNLCDRYCMRTEHLTDDGKYLDLALSINPDFDPNIAIEMKWAGFRKNGSLYENSRLNMIDDAVKLHKMSFSYKYLMQFAILNINENKKINYDTIVKNFYNFNKWKFKNGVLHPEPIFIRSFPTWDEGNNPRRFTLFFGKLLERKCYIKWVRIICKLSASRINNSLKFHRILSFRKYIPTSHRLFDIPVLSHTNGLYSVI